MNTIGKRIIFLRENLDLTQVKLASQVGITKMTLYKYEKDLNEPKGEIISKLADALDTSADFLLGRTSTSTPLSSKNNELTLCREREKNVLAKFRKLTAENQAKIEERIDTLMEAQTSDRH